MGHETDRNEGNATSIDRYVLQDEKLKDLKSYIEKCLKSYVENIYAPDEQFTLSITQSWVNYSKKGEYHHNHFHTNSLVSGVFYINADKEKDKIFFYKREADLFKFLTNSHNPFNIDSIFIPVNTGDMVMFPSNLAHSVPAVETDETRISLAFNTFPVGTIGNHKFLNKLVISDVS